MARVPSIILMVVERYLEDLVFSAVDGRFSV